MKIKKVIALFIAAFILVGGVFPAALAAEGEQELSLSAKSAILIEQSTGRVLYEKNADTRLPMASTTKIMTGLLAIESGRLWEVVTITEEMTGAIGTSLYLKEGEELTLEDLTYGLMLRSGNDAAEAIAIHLAGSIEEFSKMMNDRARELGLLNTNFENPHGLPNENHYTTAKELALLGAHAMQNETFRKIVGTESVTLQNLNEDREEGDDGIRHLTGHNKLLNLYEGATGVKTGFTTASGRTLVGSATRDGMDLVAVTLNAPDDWNDHIKLFNYGFSNYHFAALAPAMSLEKKVRVTGGVEEKVTANNEVPFYFPVRSDGSETFKIRYDLPQFTYAPVLVGEKLGYGTIMDDLGQVIARVPILSQEEVELKPLKPGPIKLLIAFIKDIQLWFF